MAKKKAAITPEAYKAAVDRASLLQVCLAKSEFTVVPEAYSGDRSSWRFNVSCDVADCYFEESENAIFAIVEAEAWSKKAKKRLLQAKCQYLVVFEVEGKPETEAALAFARRFSRFAAYPYFRSHFAELCSQAALTIPPLPTMREGSRRIIPAEILSTPEPETKRIQRDED